MTLLCCEFNIISYQTLVYISIQTGLYSYTTGDAFNLKVFLLFLPFLLAFHECVEGI